MSDNGIIKTFLTRVEVTVEGLFNEAKSEYDKLAPEVKSATAAASGIFAIINKDVAATPDAVWALIETKYPTVTKESVTAFIVKANNVVNGANALASNATFEEALVALQSYLNTLEGNTWITIIKAVVTIAIDVLTPGTIIQKVEMILEYIYQNLVKPHLAVAA